MRSLVLPALLWIAAALPLFADARDVDAWFHAEARARPYAAAEADILDAFAAAESAGIPDAPLMDKLKEGAAKGVSADALLGAVRAEARRLSVIQAVFSRQGYVFPGTDALAGALETFSFLMVAGMDAVSLESIAASGAGRDAGDVVEAAKALLQVKLSTRLPGATIAALGTAILKSSLPRSVFPSLPPLLIRAATQGGDGSDLAALVGQVLSSGGGLLQLQDAVRNRPAGGQAAAARPAAGEGQRVPVGATASTPGKPAAPGVQGGGAGTAGGAGAAGGVDHRKRE